MCVPTNPTEKHSSFALSPSSHTARHDFKGDAHDDDDDDGDDDDDDDDDDGVDNLIIIITHSRAGPQK